MMKTRLDNDITDHTCVVYTKNNTELSQLIGRMWYVTKTRQDKDMTNRNSAIYTENETELS